MKKFSLSIATLSLLLLASCTNNEDKDATKDKKESNKQEKTADEHSDSKEENHSATKTAVAVMESKSGSSLTGKVTFTEKNGEVTMEALIKGLPEGKHAIHIHEKGDCSSKDGKSAGGHWNPTNQPHGKWGSPEGYHKGDIGNFTTKPDGVGAIALTTNEWCIGCDDKTKNIVGKSIIVHDGTDDFTSQPSGDAGTRVGCGAIEMK